MKTFTKMYEIHAPVADVWQALVDTQVIEKWGGGPAIMDDQVGTEWKLWGGSLFGKNTEVIPQQKLVQDWSDDSGWDGPSKCTFELQEEKGKTKLTHENILDDSYTDVAEGWDQYYIGPLSELAEKA